MSAVPTSSSPSGLQRFLLAFAAWFKVLFDRQFAERVWALRGAAVSLPAAAATATAALAPPARPDPGPRAIQVLAILQRDGRLIDFLQEDLSGASDADIGAAVRSTVWQGCRKALNGMAQVTPVLDEAEGAHVKVPAGFDPSRIRITGNVVGNPPFEGTLKHRGWRVAEIHLPDLPSGTDGQVIAPAEVELA